MDRNKVQVHNIGEERSVGFFNYEIGIWGKKNIESASRKMVLNKSHDLLNRAASFRRFLPQAKEIKELKVKWNERMAGLQVQGYNEKEVLNLKLEAQKLEDLEFLKNQTYPGPFTNITDVNAFMEAVPESKLKNDRMYREIRFQRNSSTALKRDAKVFRLKGAHKNLDTSDYASNLCQYLDHSKGGSNLSMGDLRNVLNGLNSIMMVKL